MNLGVAPAEAELDLLTDALVLVGQHGVYCQSARQPGKPAMDIQLITKSISDAKDLISGVMTGPIQVTGMRKKTSRVNKPRGQPSRSRSHP